MFFKKLLNIIYYNILCILELLVMVLMFTDSLVKIFYFLVSFFICVFIIPVILFMGVFFFLFYYIWYLITKIYLNIIFLQDRELVIEFKKFNFKFNNYFTMFLYFFFIDIPRVYAFVYLYLFLNFFRRETVENFNFFNWLEFLLSIFFRVLFTFFFHTTILILKSSLRLSNLIVISNMFNNKENNLLRKFDFILLNSYNDFLKNSDSLVKNLKIYVHRNYTRYNGFDFFNLKTLIQSKLTGKIHKSNPNVLNWIKTKKLEVYKNTHSENYNQQDNVFTIDGIPISEFHFVHLSQTMYELESYITIVRGKLDLKEYVAHPHAFLHPNSINDNTNIYFISESTKPFLKIDNIKLSPLLESYGSFDFNKKAYNYGPRYIFVSEGGDTNVVLVEDGNVQGKVISIVKAYYFDLPVHQITNINSNKTNTTFKQLIDQSEEYSVVKRILQKASGDINECLESSIYNKENSNLNKFNEEFFNDKKAFINTLIEKHHIDIALIIQDITDKVTGKK